MMRRVVLLMKMMLMMFNGIYYLLDSSDSIHADDDDCIDNGKTMELHPSEMALFDYNHDAVHGAPQYHWIIIVTITQLI